MQEIRIYIYTDAPVRGEKQVVMRYLLQYIKDGKEIGSKREKARVIVTTNHKGATLETMITAIDRIGDGNKIPVIIICHCSGDFMAAVNQGYYKRWSLNAWQNSKGIEVEHADLWERLYKLIEEKAKSLKARAPYDTETDIMRSLGAEGFIGAAKLA